MNKYARFLGLFVNIIGFLLLIIAVCFSPSSYVYDERFHILGVELLKSQSLSLKFLQGTGESAPGPLYFIIHYLFEPITNLNGPQIRLVNILFLVLTIFVLFLICKTLSFTNPLVSSFRIMSAPVIWPIAGMALTEIPSMFFAMSGILLLLISTSFSRADSKKNLLLAIFGGFLFGIAILGRQTFIAILLATPLLTINNYKKSGKYVICFIISSLIIPICLFLIWGGLVPPGQEKVSQGISLINGFLSLSIVGFMFFIFSPKWFNVKFTQSLLILISLIVVNLVFKLAQIPFALFVVNRILPESLIPVYALVASGLIMSIGILFLISTIKNLIKKSKNNIFLFLSISTILLASTAFKITHYYSTRYTAISIPLIILLSEEYSEDNFWKVARMIGGNLLGFLMLESYFIRSWPQF